MSLLGVDSGGSVKLLPIYLVKDDFIFQRVKPIEISSVSMLGSNFVTTAKYFSKFCL